MYTKEMAVGLVRGIRVVIARTLQALFNLWSTVKLEHDGDCILYYTGLYRHWQ